MGPMGASVGQSFIHFSTWRKKGEAFRLFAAKINFDFHVGNRLVTE
jgi:hypothetical protein